MKLPLPTVPQVIGALPLRLHEKLALTLVHQRPGIGNVALAKALDMSPRGTQDLCRRLRTAGYLVNAGSGRGQVRKLSAPLAQALKLPTVDDTSSVPKAQPPSDTLNVVTKEKTVQELIKELFDLENKFQETIHSRDGYVAVARLMADFQLGIIDEITVKLPPSELHLRALRRRIEDRRNLFHCFTSIQLTSWKMADKLKASDVIKAATPDQRREFYQRTGGNCAALRIGSADLQCLLA